MLLTFSGRERREWGVVNCRLHRSRAKCLAPAWVERDFWMARRDKLPWAPWNGSRKWGNPENWASKATVDEWAEMDPRADGHVALLEREDNPYTDDPDPYVFVDGDDVRCPETGEVHPRFVDILDRLGSPMPTCLSRGPECTPSMSGSFPRDTSKPSSTSTTTLGWERRSTDRRNLRR